MKRSRLFWLLVALLVFGVASEARYYLQQESLLFSEERLAVEVLDDSVEPVRQRFEEGVGRWRMLVLVSPMAPVSTAALDSILEDFLAPAPALPLDVSVVFFHGLPWDHRGKARTRPRWSAERRWRFFWDPEDRVGATVLAAQLGLRGLGAGRLEGRILLYGPEGSWVETDQPPAPTVVLSGKGARIGGQGPLATELRALRERIEVESVSLELLSDGS